MGLPVAIVLSRTLVVTGFALTACVVGDPTGFALTACVVGDPTGLRCVKQTYLAATCC